MNSKVNRWANKAVLFAGILYFSHGHLSCAWAIIGTYENNIYTSPLGLFSATMDGKVWTLEKENVNRPQENITLYNRNDDVINIMAFAHPGESNLINLDELLNKGKAKGGNGIITQTPQGDRCILDKNFKESKSAGKGKFRAVWIVLFNRGVNSFTIELYSRGVKDKEDGIRYVEALYNVLWELFRFEDKAGQRLSEYDQNSWMTAIINAAQKATDKVGGTFKVEKGKALKLSCIRKDDHGENIVAGLRAREKDGKIYYIDTLQSGGRNNWSAKSFQRKFMKELSKEMKQENVEIYPDHEAIEEGSPENIEIIKESIGNYLDKNKAK